MRSDRPLALAFLAAATALGALAWASAALPTSFFGIDVLAYTSAAQRLIDTGSPYSQQVLTGPVANVAENVPIGFFYPPVVAQLFAPFASVPTRTLALGWALLQVSTAILVFPRLLPHPDKLVRVAIPAGLALAFWPFEIALLGGNVSLWLAIGFAGMLIATDQRRIGAIASAMTMIKLTPAPLLAAAWLGRKSRVGSLAAFGVIAAASVAAAPRAWSDWLRAIPNILRNEMAPASSNLSPAHVLADLGFPSAGGIVELSIAGTFAAAACLRVRRDGSLSPQAISLGIGATTFASTTLWDHYLVVFVPLLLFWWHRGDGGARAVLGATYIVLMALWLALDVIVVYRLLLAVLVVLSFAVTGCQRASTVGDEVPAFER